MKLVGVEVESSFRLFLFKGLTIFHGQLWLPLPFRGCWLRLLLIHVFTRVFIVVQVRLRSC